MSYYFRHRGKVYGPYTEQQIRGMRTKGSISRTTELSDDGQVWRLAAECAFLYPQSINPVSNVSVVDTSQEYEITLPLDDGAPQWWHRIGAIVALAALLATITLGVGVFALLQEPTPTPTPAVSPPNETPSAAVTPNETPPPAPEQNETPAPESDPIPPSDPFVVPNTNNEDE